MWLGWSHVTVTYCSFGLDQAARIFSTHSDKDCCCYKYFTQTPDFCGLNISVIHLGMIM
jgi:hypothetical protein